MTTPEKRARKKANLKAKRDRLAAEKAADPRRLGNLLPGLEQLRRPPRQILKAGDEDA